MTIRNLEYAFRARSVAIIGASPREGSVGLFVTQNVREAGFKGPIWPVNPKHGSHLRAALLPRRRLPARRAGSCHHRDTAPRPFPGLIAELGERGTRAASRAHRGPDRARAACARRCSTPPSRTCCASSGRTASACSFPASASTPASRTSPPQPGKLAFLSQSGALRLGRARLGGRSRDRLLQRRLARRHGRCRRRRHARHARRRQQHARRSCSTSRPSPTRASSCRRHAPPRALKPVIVIKAGRHAAGAKAAATHTGALAGSDGAVDAAFRRAGLLRVDRPRGAVRGRRDAGPLRADRARTPRHRHQWRRRRRAGDRPPDRLWRRDWRRSRPETLDALDKVLPATWSKANPVDIIGDAGPERYRAAIEGVFDDDNVDALLVMNCPTALASPSGSAQAVADTVRDIDASSRRASSRS